MDLKLLRNFLQIADLESFTKAAAVLHIAQPALSRQVGQLERELGVRLFTRTERGVHLTEAGALFRQRASGLIDDFQRLRHEVTLLSDEPAGELTFGVPPSMLDTGRGAGPPSGLPGPVVRDIERLAGSNVSILRI